MPDEPLPDESLSLLLRVWRQPNGGATCIQAIRIDAPPGLDEVRFKDASFLVRIGFDRGRVTERCFIRHIASARQAYVQGGFGLRAFIAECLLDRDAAPSMLDTQPPH